MKVASFSEIAVEFQIRVERDLCCNFATLDRQNRLRSRVVHPLWEGMVCWVLTDRRTPKAVHIAHCPFVSLAYIRDNNKPAYAECTAEWVEDIKDKQRTWDLFNRSSLGYDPALFYKSVNEPYLALLKLTPWRIQIDNTPGQTYIWERG